MRLSLCIPTYNRAELLRAMLDRLIIQVEALPDAWREQIEVFVSDNASPDATQEVIADLRERHPRCILRSFRQERNLGPDVNIHTAAKRADGEFVYLLSDDDLLLPGALAKLTSLIDTYPEADAFTLNVRHFHHDPNEPGSPSLNFPQDTLLQGKDAMLTGIDSYICFISAFAFRKRLIRTDYSDRYGTFFVQGYFYLDLLAAARGLVITAEPYLAQRAGNGIPLNWCHVYVTSFQGLMRYAKQIGFSRSVTEGILRRYFVYVRWFVREHRLYAGWSRTSVKYSLDRRDALRRIFPVYRRHPLFWLEIVPLLLLPSGLLGLLRRAWLRLRGRPLTPAVHHRQAITPMDAPLLSLCMPTYNRAPLLQEALQAIAAQLAGPSAFQRVELIVSDNASTDATQETIEAFRCASPQVQLRSFTQATNLGADANIRFVMRQASGRFVFLLSDDDLLLPGAVAHLLERIETCAEMDAVSLNIRLFEGTPDRAQPPYFCLEADRVIRDREEVLKALGSVLTFMSVMAFRRDLIDPDAHEDRIGTSLIQCFYFLDALAACREFHITSHAYLAQRADNTGGWSFFKVFITSFSAVLDYAQSLGFSYATIKGVRSRHLRFLLNFVLIFKIQGRYGTLRPNFPDAAVRLLRSYTVDPYALGVILPTLLCPGSLLRLLRSLRRNLKGHRGAADLPADTA